MPEARLRTTDLRSELALAIPHHKSFLGTRIEQLKMRQVDLKLIADGLNREPDALSPGERIRLLETTGAILEWLSAQCGELRSSVAKGVSNG